MSSDRQSNVSPGKCELIHASLVLQILLDEEQWKWIVVDDDSEQDDRVFGVQLLRHGRTVKRIHTYFSNLEARKCCLNLAGPKTSLTNIRLVRNDGRDSGIEEGTMLVQTTDPLQQNIQLDDKEFAVYKHAVLCAEFPVLAAPGPPSPHSPASTPKTTFRVLIRSPHLSTKSSQSRERFSEDSDSDESTSPIQTEMLFELVRQAFNLTSDKHQYYSEIIMQGLGRKTPAKLLVEELVSQLAILENNRHPFYSPQSFLSRNAYDQWQQRERTNISILINKFWHFSLPSPPSVMSKSQYWFNRHEEYSVLMHRLLRFETSIRRNSAFFMPLSSSSRRLLKEFGQRYGVGELYMKIVYLEYLANNFENEVGVIRHITKTVDKVFNVLHLQYRGRLIMTRTEFENLQQTVVLLHGQCGNSLTRIKRLFPDNQPVDGLESLIGLLSSVLKLKSFLSGKKCHSTDHWLKQYMQENFAIAYERYKLIATTELNLNAFTMPLSPRLMNILLFNIRDEVDNYKQYYNDVFHKYFDIVQLSAKVFYNFLMEDVKQLCILSDQEEESGEIDLMMLSLAYRLNTLDNDWATFILPQDQVWRQSFLHQIGKYLFVLRDHMISLVIQSIQNDKYHGLKLPDELEDMQFTSSQDFTRLGPAPTTFLAQSEHSAFSSVPSSGNHTPRSPQCITKRLTPIHVKSPLDDKPDIQSVLSSKEGRESPNHMSTITANQQQDGNQVTPGSAAAGGGNFNIDDEFKVTSVRTIKQNEIDGNTTSASEDEILSFAIKEISHSTDVKQLVARSYEIESQLAQVGARAQSAPQETMHQFPLSDESPSCGYNSAASMLSDDDVTAFGVSGSLVTVTEHNNPSAIEASAIKDEIDEALCKEDITSDQNVITDLTECHKTSTHELSAQVNEPLDTESATGHTDKHNSMQGIHVIPTAALPDSQTSTSRDSFRTIHSSIPSSVSVVREDAPLGDLLQTDSQTSLTSCAETAEEKEKLEKFLPVSSSVIDVICVVKRLSVFVTTMYEMLQPKHDCCSSCVLNEDYTLEHMVAMGDVRKQAQKIGSTLFSKMLQVFSSTLCNYADNTLCLDLCATSRKTALKMLGRQLLQHVRNEMKTNRIWGCRHMLMDEKNCYKYIAKESKYLSDSFEPVTQEMCTRINNISALTHILPDLQNILTQALPLYNENSQPADDPEVDSDPTIGDYVVIGEISSESLASTPDPEVCSSDSATAGTCTPSDNIYRTYPQYQSLLDVVFGHCEWHLCCVTDSLVNLLAHKLNLFFQQGLSLLVELDMEGYTIERRFEPLTKFLKNYLRALSQWLYPDNYDKVYLVLWYFIVQDFENEAYQLRRFGNRAEAKAMLLLQALSYMIEFIHDGGDGLSIDQIIPPAEHVMQLLQLYSWSTKKLIHLYRRLVVQKSRENGSLDISLELPPRETLKRMRHDLHTIRKCFSGKQLVDWILINYSFQGTANIGFPEERLEIDEARLLAQKLLDLGVIRQAVDDMNTFVSPTRARSSTTTDASSPLPSPYPEVTFHSRPHSSLKFQRSCNSDGNSLERARSSTIDTDEMRSCPEHAMDERGGSGDCVRQTGARSEVVSDSMGEIDAMNEVVSEGVGQIGARNEVVGEVMVHMAEDGTKEGRRESSVFESQNHSEEVGNLSDGGQKKRLSERRGKNLKEVSLVSFDGREGLESVNTEQIAVESGGKDPSNRDTLPDDDGGVGFVPESTNDSEIGGGDAGTPDGNKTQQSASTSTTRSSTPTSSRTTSSVGSSGHMETLRFIYSPNHLYRFTEVDDEELYSYHSGLTNYSLTDYPSDNNGNDCHRIKLGMESKAMDSFFVLSVIYCRKGKDSKSRRFLKHVPKEIMDEFNNRKWNFGCL